VDDVVWTRRARRNLDDIGDYIAQDNPAAAERTVRRIVEQVSGLAFYPRIGRVGTVEDTRELVISDTPYIAVYRIRERVEVLRIRHGAQRWPEAF
jgi:addiction module RelE/StbE family toxin